MITREAVGQAGKRIGRLRGLSAEAVHVSALEKIVDIIQIQGLADGQNQVGVAADKGVGAGMVVQGVPKLPDELRFPSQNLVGANLVRVGLV